MGHIGRPQRLSPFRGCREYGSWDFDFQILNVGNETADLDFPNGSLDLGAGGRKALRCAYSTDVVRSAGGSPGADPKTSEHPRERAATANENRPTRQHAEPGVRPDPQL